MDDLQKLVAAHFNVAHFLPVTEILASKSRAYLDLIPRSGSARADEFRVWFFDKVRRFDGGADLSQLPAVQTFLGKFGHREKNAFRTAQTLVEDGLDYWEGYALHATLPVPVAIHHAWNTNGDALVDVTWSKGKENKNIYLGVPVTRDFLRHIQAELAAGQEAYHGPAAFFLWALGCQTGLEQYIAHDA